MAIKKKSSNPAVKYMREELGNVLPQYDVIRDCVAGETAIKGFVLTANGSTAIELTRAKKYLPMPNAQDQSPENRERYRSYVQRAVYTNFTGNTLNGMIGQVFLVKPVVKLPTKLAALMEKDADGEGLNLTQLSKRAVRYVGQFARAGILTDYPPTNGPTTADKIESGEIRPILTVYDPKNIVNWQTKKRGVKTVLSLVVLREPMLKLASDGFQVQQIEQYRVLRLDDKDQYTVEVFKFDSDGNEAENVPIYVPKDSNGEPFNEIPFTFIGAENNDAAVDTPTLYDIASLNIAHYRNSADYEESAFLCGQPTPVASGITREWYENVMQKQITLGSRNGIPLPEGATIELIQAEANSLPKEAMELKEAQMIAIGAKIVSQKPGLQTATKVLSDKSGEQSTLTNIATNVSEAFVYALRFAARFLGESEDEIKFELNTDFELNQMSLDDVSKLIAIWQKGAMPFEEMRAGLRKAGLASMDDDKAKKQIQEEVAAGMVPSAVVDPTKPIDASGKANAKDDPAAHAIEPTTRNVQ